MPWGFWRACGEQLRSATDDVDSPWGDSDGAAGADPERRAEAEEDVGAEGPGAAAPE